MYQLVLYCQATTIIYKYIFFYSKNTLVPRGILCFARVKYSTSLKLCQRKHFAVLMKRGALHWARGNERILIHSCQGERFSPLMQAHCFECGRETLLFAHARGETFALPVPRVALNVVMSWESPSICLCKGGHFVSLVPKKALCFARTDGSSSEVQDTFVHSCTIWYNKQHP